MTLELTPTEKVLFCRLALAFAEQHHHKPEVQGKLRSSSTHSCTLRRGNTASCPIPSVERAVSERKAP